jgi:aminopeptidase-like protein
MFKEWSIKEAWLDLVEPEMRLADYSAEPISVIQKSYPIDLRDTPVDLVLLDQGCEEENYPDIDLEGKWVFIRGHISKYGWVYKRGALGLLTDYIMETADRKRSDLYRSLTYTSYWHTHLKDEPEGRGFVISPETGDRLAKMCRKKWNEEQKYLQVRPYIDSALYKGHIEVVEVIVEGKDDQYVNLCAHLCHPRSSCNDNASGVSASLEAMNVINILVKEGKIGKPEHTIRLTLVPEYTGTFAYLSDHDDYDKVIGAMNLDMVGGKQNRKYGPITLTKTPLTLPSLISELSVYSMEQAAKEASSLSGGTVSLTNYCTSPYSGGSDHTVYCDSTVGIPCCMLGQWPDLNYHTATDTLDVIDPAVLKFSCLTAVNFAYGLACISADDLPVLFEILEKNIVETKTALVQEYLDKKISKEMFGSLLVKYKQYFTDCVRSAEKLVNAGVSEEVRHIGSMFDEWIRHYGAEDSYPAEEGMEEVYVRTAVGPYQQLSDYRALGYDEAVDAYEKTKDHDLHEFDGIVLNYIDGKRSAAEIVRQVSLEYRRDMKKQVKDLLELLEKIQLIRKI